MPDLKRVPDGGNVDVSTVGPSPALLAAQRRLENLRAAKRSPPRASVGSAWPGLAGVSALRPANPDQVADPLPAACSHPQTAGESTGDEHTPATIRLQPALALAILGAEQAAAGRIWLLLRFLDEAGQGWLTTDRIREHLTRKNGDARRDDRTQPKGSHRQERITPVCGRRQLRNLLKQGQGIFWERQAAQAGARERIWLRSPARVAAALGLERLSGRPVEIPLSALIGGIGRVRATFYGTFHRGRQSGPAPGAPISRSKMAALTHVPPRTQRLYDQEIGVQRQANYAVGPAFNKQVIQERAWQHGRAVFKFVDHQGKHGPAGWPYVAWRLPNSYAILDSNLTDGASTEKRKRNKKRPVDLVTIGAQGNDRTPTDCPRHPVTLFHTDGAAAGKAYNRDCSLDAYWPEAGKPVVAGVKMWQVIGRNSFRRARNLLPGL